MLCPWVNDESIHALDLLGTLRRGHLPASRLDEAEENTNETWCAFG